MKVKAFSEGHASPCQAIYCDDSVWAKYMHDEIPWTDINFNIMPNGTYAGPILGVTTAEIAPNLSVWMARIPSPGLDSFRVVCLGANLQVSIGNTSPVFATSERRKKRTWTGINIANCSASVIASWIS